MLRIETSKKFFNQLKKKEIKQVRRYHSRQRWYYWNKHSAKLI